MIAQIRNEILSSMFAKLKVETPVMHGTAIVNEFEGASMAKSVGGRIYARSEQILQVRLITPSKVDKAMAHDIDRFARSFEIMPAR